jgi:hypothetical protein
MTTKHADFEALSAFVDGEAPEWADHVAGCPQCRATAAELRAMSAAVGKSPGPAPAAQRDSAIAAALDAAGLHTPAHARVIPLERRRSPRPWAMPAAAAVVVGLLGLSGFVLTSNRSTDETTTVAGPAFDAKTESAVPGSPQAPVGDLGDVADPATLRARALGVTPAASSAGSSVSRSNSSSADAGATAPQASATNTGNSGGGLSSTSGAGGGGAGGSATVIAPNAVGTRPCEERARGREAGLGPVTYFATARQGATPAYVLGFGTSGGGVTLLMLAQDGCTELLRSAGP